MIAFFRQHFILTSVVVLLIVLVATTAGVYRHQVDYVSPKHGPIIEAIYGLGKVKADKFYEAKLAIIKTVEKVFVNEGDYVKQGTILVRLDGELEIAAPFDGTVTAIHYRDSQPVFPQQSILRLEDIRHKYIEVSLEQQGALRVKKGQPVTVLFESIRGEKLHGVVNSIFPRQDEFLAHISVDGLGENVLPGMTADIAIEIKRKKNALLIPLSAVTNGTVKVLRDGKKLSVPLKIGGIDGNWAEVVEGDITTEDQVIIRKRK